MSGIGELIDEIHENAVAKGFWDGDKVVDAMIERQFPAEDVHKVASAMQIQKLMLIVSELSEAMEAHRGERFANVDVYRNCQKADDILEEDMPLYITGAFKRNIKDSFEDELADAVIRIFDLAGGMNIDLEWHIQEKMKYNKTREHLHGKTY